MTRRFYIGFQSESEQHDGVHSRTQGYILFDGPEQRDWTSKTIEDVNADILQFSNSCGQITYPITHAVILSVIPLQIIE